MNVARPADERTTTLKASRSVSVRIQDRNLCYPLTTSIDTFVNTSMPVVDYYKASNKVVEASRTLLSSKRLINLASIRLMLVSRLTRSMHTRPVQSESVCQFKEYLQSNHDLYLLRGITRLHQSIHRIAVEQLRVYLPLSP